MGSDSIEILMENFMDKKYLKISIAVLLVFILVNVIVYVSMLSSEAFTVAKKHVQVDKEVIAKLGSEFEISLQPYGYGISSDGNIGDAHLIILATNDDTKLKVYVELKQKNGDWDVIDSKFK